MVHGCLFWGQKTGLNWTYEHYIPPNQVSPHLSGDVRGMRGQLAAVGSKMGDGW